MSDQWSDVWEVFHEALETPPSGREALLIQRCVDEGQRSRVRELICAHERRPGFMETPPVEFAPAVGDGAVLEQVEGYEILGVLGEGGMGVVYEALQHEPVERRVALKVVRAGLGSSQILARFASERQMLARMTHPSIAQMYDAGKTVSGRPFFAMEFVEGVPITRYCEDKSLPLRDRLRLFLRVCEGVQHAHQKGIIHRDIKPANILVRDEISHAGATDHPSGAEQSGPLPKILDFGIAKLIEHDSATATRVTHAGEIVGTPAYMSPEQIRGLDVDTRSDAYSLGVLLYQLLCGSLPFETGGASLADVQRMVCESVPVRPSAAMGDVPGPIARRQIKGDLDWITLKALEKERSRRYGSVSEFAADVARHLSYEPVLAGPPGAWYRLRKLARRNRAAFAAGVVVLVSLTGAVVGTSIALARARQAEHRARMEAEIAVAINVFIDEALASADPAYGQDLTMRNVLDSAAGRIEGAFDDAPRVEGSLRRTIARSYQRLGMYDDAAAQFELAHARLEAGGATLEDQGECLIQLAWVLNLRGQFAQAQGVLDRVDAMLTRFDAPGELGARSELVRADVLAEQGDVTEANRLFSHAVGRLRATMAPDDPELAGLLGEYAMFLRARREYDRAQGVYDEVLQIQLRTMSENHPEVLTTRNNVAMLVLYRGDYAGSRPLLEANLIARRDALPADHPDIAESANNLAIALERLGELDRAIELYQEASEILADAFGEVHPNIASLLFNVGSIQQGQGQLEEAEATFLESLRIDRALRGDTHAYIADTLLKLGRIAFDNEDYPLALERFDECIRIRTQVLPDGHEKIPSARASFGATLVRLGRGEEGYAMLSAAFEALKEIKGLEDADTQYALRHVIEGAALMGDNAQAAAYRQMLDTGEPP